MGSNPPFGSKKDTAKSVVFFAGGAEEQGAFLIGISDTKKKRQTDWSKCQSVCRFFIKIRVLGVNQFIQNNLIGPIRMLFIRATHSI